MSSIQDVMVFADKVVQELKLLDQDGEFVTVEMGSWHGSNAVIIGGRIFIQWSGNGFRCFTRSGISMERKSRFPEIIVQTALKRWLQSRIAEVIE